MPAERAGVRPPLMTHIRSRLTHCVQVHGHHVPHRSLSFHGSLQNSRASRGFKGRDEERRDDKVGMVTPVCQNEDSGDGVTFPFLSHLFILMRCKIFNGRKTDQCGVITFGSEGAYCLYFFYPQSQAYNQLHMNRN